MGIQAYAAGTDIGGDTGGASGAWTFRRDDSGWRVSAWSVGYLRAQYRQTFAVNYVPDPEEPSFLDESAVRRCLVDALEADADTDFLRIYKQAPIAGEEEAYTEAVSKCLIESSGASLAMAT